MELRRRVARARSTDDLGASAIEWVIITGILVAMAAAVGLIIYNIVKDKAGELKAPAAPDGIKGGA
ncbi:hypothetical protein IC607_07060 [Cellulomonas sp. JH27-2]|uniref:hypothetical protein n=1 Tax=Cellulomonas sp. JH27-2 TaxID=2774139 RepID=UPI00178684B8|nr:hypothetical protein [Cellulomonas sp. JH27-2]MBD8058722.1 hypothetical protein [Cellulomonas sp. JH27-2]